MHTYTILLNEKAPYKKHSYGIRFECIQTVNEDKDLSEPTHSMKTNRTNLSVLPFTTVTLYTLSNSGQRSTVYMEGDIPFLKLGTKHVKHVLSPSGVGCLSHQSFSYLKRFPSYEGIRNSG